MHPTDEREAKRVSGGGEKISSEFISFEAAALVMRL